MLCHTICYLSQCRGTKLPVTCWEYTRSKSAPISHCKHSPLWFLSLDCLSNLGQSLLSCIHGENLSVFSCAEYPFCFCYHTVPLLFWVLQTILMRNYKYTLNTACTDIFMYLHAKQIIHLMFFIWSKHNYSLHGYICDFTTKSCMIVTVIAFSFLKHAGNSYLNKLHKLCIK